jgi:hypothetical protein
MQRLIWISYDLGVKGDYEGLFAWLDDHKAKECVGLALIRYDCDADLIQCLKEDIGNAIEVNKRTRIYVVWQDPKTEKAKGRFIFGGRRAAPWVGYGTAEEQVEVDES